MSLPIAPDVDPVPPLSTVFELPLKLTFPPDVTVELYWVLVTTAFPDMVTDPCVTNGVLDGDDKIEPN